MNPADLSLQDMAYVLAIAQTNSFSRAAEACHVSQPTLSKQIQRLEAALGVMVFERGTRHVHLTEAGQALIPQAQAMLDAAQSLLDTAQSWHQPMAGTLRLGVIASACPYVMPLFLPALRKQYPQLQLIVQEGLTDNLMAALKQGTLDAVIAANTEDPALWAVTSLYFEPFVLVYGPGYQFSKQIRPQDITPEALLLLEEGHCLKDQTMDLCQLPETALTNQFKATGVETLIQMAAAGMGVAIIPKLAVPKNKTGLKQATFQAKTVGRTMQLYARKTTASPKRLALLAACIISQLPKTVIV